MNWIAALRDFLLVPPTPTEPGRPAGPAAVERFGDVEVAAALGDAIVTARPDAREKLQRVRDLLPDLTRDEKNRLVDGVVRRFALVVLDLPASEAAHHARPWGLFDHSLDAGLLALEKVAGAGRLAPTGDPVRDRKLAPRYRYAAFFLGLLHDIGKIADVTVCAPGAEEWRRFREPLAVYASRHRLVGVYDYCRQVSGRGQTRHVVMAPSLYERVGGPEPMAYLDDVLVEVLDSPNRRGEARRAVAHIVADAVALADLDDSREDVAKPPEPPQQRPPTLPKAFATWKSASIVELFSRALEMTAVSAEAAAEIFGLDDAVAVRYPAGVALVLDRMRALWAACDRRIANITPDANGVRSLTGELAALGALRLDPATKEWKHQAAVDGRAMEVVLVERRSAGRAVAKTTLEVRVLSPVTHRVVEASPPVVPPPSAPTTTRPIYTPYDGPPVVRRIREELLGGQLTVNEYRADCYITVGAVYVVRTALERIVGALGMNPDLMEGRLTVLCNALGHTPEVLRTERGKVHHWIKTHPEANSPVGAIALQTCRLLSKGDLARLTFYSHEILVRPTYRMPVRKENPV